MVGASLYCTKHIVMLLDILKVCLHSDHTTAVHSIEIQKKKFFFL